MTQQKPILWTISGSDCSGGAGIAADIKTAHALGVEVCHLITANTVQNSLEVISVNPVSVDILQAQWQALLTDKPPKIIKIGLLATIEQINWLSHAINQLKQSYPAVICLYDPVGQASVGRTLHQLTLADLTPLLSCIDVITPNLVEAQTLAELPNEQSSSVLAEQIFLKYHIKSVIIKGGHVFSQAYNQTNAVDYCLHYTDSHHENAQIYQLSSQRITTHYNHGGGCCFATALASFLAHHYLQRDAFVLAKAFINQGLQASYQQSKLKNHQYYGAFEVLSWPTDAQYFPTILDSKLTDKMPSQTFRSLELKQEKLALYPVVDSLAWLEKLLPLGLNIIQLRIKNTAKDQLETIIKDAIALAKQYKTRLFINDYWQLAIKYGAYGVHIGQEDLQKADLKQMHQAGLRLGISTHGCYEFLLAQQLRPSYLAIGAIFPTKTKNMTGQIQGIDNLSQILRLKSGKDFNNLPHPIPVVAIGGITFENAKEVLATGVDSIAVVTAITNAKDPRKAVITFNQLIKN